MLPAVNEQIQLCVQAKLHHQMDTDSYIQG